MYATYELVKLGKARQGIPTDNKFAESLGLHRGHINNWKKTGCKPDVDNLKLLADAAGITMDEAYKIVNKPLLRETGFADIGLLTAMSLSGVTWVYFGNEFIALAGIIAPVIHYTKSEELELDRFSAANDEIFDSRLSVVIR